MKFIPSSMGATTFFPRIRRSVAELGLANAILYYLAEMLGRASRRRMTLRRYLIVAQPVPDKPVISLADSKTVIRQVNATDPAVAAFPRPTNVIVARYAAGYTCLQASIGGTFVGFIWLAFGAYEEDEVRCRYQLADGEKLAWDFDVYVEPRYRLGRSFARLWQAANNLLRAQGIEWTLSRISAFNASSLAAHARLGTVSLGYATFLCLGPLQFAFLPGNLLPRASWNEASRPILILDSPRAATPPRSGKLNHAR